MQLQSAIIHFSDILIRGMGYCHAGDTKVPKLSKRAWDLLNLSPADIDQIIEEVEEKLWDVKGFSLEVNAGIEKLYKISLSIAQDKFTATDGRTVRILGKEGEVLIEQLDTAKLSGPYDVKVQKTTALSQSKALMVQQITQLEAMRPGFLSDEELYDLLDLGDRNKFYDVATAARRTAALENERMREGKEVPEPRDGEFHLVHWTMHMTMLQSPTFSLKTTPEVKMVVEEHIAITEMEMIELAKKNVAFAQALLAQEYFPAFYTPDFQLTEIVTALQQGQTVPALGERDDDDLEEQALLAQGGLPLSGEETPEGSLPEGPLPQEEFPAAPAGETLPEEVGEPPLQ